ncbi:MAG: HAD family phosphatase, partial [Alphaproteobacteria bacterium]|nr:HAD family phosphatase [Alphaproteobacteria bacterium]
EALFIDDKEINVNAARALGMHGIVFKTASQLSSDISAFGLLPAAQ